MKEYEYTIIRRESRNPKRNREGRGISQSDLEALKQELAGDQKDGLNDVLGELAVVDDLSDSVSGLAVVSDDLRKRLGTAEETLSGKLDSGAFDKWKAGDYSQRQSALNEAIKSKQPAGDYALSSELESHKRAIDKSFEALNNHPLSVDKDGFWQIWSIKDGAYKTTEYQSRGRDGEPGAKGADGKDAGRYLGRAARLNTSITRNYRAEESRSWETANEGDYVYLTISDGDWEKGNYYIVRERTTKTVWEWYDIKGRVPVLTLDEQCRLLADGVRISAVSLKGDKGDKGETGATGAKGPKGDTPKLTLDNQYRLLADGALVSAVSLKGERGETGARGATGQTGPTGEKGPKGDTPKLTLDNQYRLLADGALVSMVSLRGPKGDKPTINWDGTKLIIDNMAPVDLRGEAGHSTSPKEVLDTDLFRQKLSEEVTVQVTPVADDLREAKSNITNLQKVALTSKMKTDLTYLTDSLQVLRSGDNSLAGLKLQRHIALSGDGANVSAYIASKPMDTALKAGITDFGKPTEREEVAINHNGTGHIGNLYFAGNQIDFRTGRDTNPYLSIGAEESEFIDNFISTARLDDTPVAVSSVTLTTSTTSYERTVDVANDGTRLTVSIGDINVATYRGATTRLTLDGEVLAEWEGVVDIISGGGGGIVIKPQYNEDPYTASNLSYERVVKAGRRTLRLEIARPNSNATATIRGLRVRRLYDTGRQQSALTKSGLRLFGSPDRYFDVDYRQRYFENLNPSGLNPNWIAVQNPYLVRIKGGAKVDKLTADELDMPGVPLCGASFDANGGQIKAFGKYVNQQGTSRALAVYYDSGRFFRVYHSIGHTNYLPTVQVIGDNGNDINWNLTARIYAVNANDFAVRIITNGDNPIRHAFSFVAFKTL